MLKRIIMALPVFLVCNLGVAQAEQSAEQVFEVDCALCHSLDRAKLGPAVKDMSKDAGVLRTAIQQGRNSMPGFQKKLSNDEVENLIEYILVNQ